MPHRPRSSEPMRSTTWERSSDALDRFPRHPNGSRRRCASALRLPREAGTAGGGARCPCLRRTAPAGAHADGPRSACDTLGTISRLAVLPPASSSTISTSSPAKSGDPDNIVRQAGTAYILAEYHLQDRDPRVRLAIERLSRSSAAVAATGRAVFSRRSSRPSSVIAVGRYKLRAAWSDSACLSSER